MPETGTSVRGRVWWDAEKPLTGQTPATPSTSATESRYANGKPPALWLRCDTTSSDSLSFATSPLNPKITLSSMNESENATMPMRTKNTLGPLRGQRYAKASRTGTLQYDR